MKNFNYLILAISVFLIVSCTKDEMPDPSGQMSEDMFDLKSASGKLKIAVVSDIHFMDPSLLPEDPSSNPWFQYYLAKDPKLIEFSDPIFRKIVSALLAEKPDLVLVPGDLTKDGELLNHETVSLFLHQLKDAGIKVFVVPGNHDINNPEALSYNGETPSPVSSVTPEEFAAIYADFGYGDPLYRDPGSLSYIVEPFKNLWILGIDACKYENNYALGTNDVSGAIRPGTMTWITGKMAEARENHITVLAMMHHGILEHYTGQNSLDPGYVIDNYPEMAVALMNAGIKLFFTGHYHANDITQLEYNGKSLADIETGSLVTPTSPYRIMILDENFIKINTRYVTSIDAELPGGMDFLTYSNSFLSGHLDFYFNYVLVNNFGVPAELAEVAAPLFRNAAMAHFTGDEKLFPAERKSIYDLSLVAPGFLPDALYSLWSDLPTADSNIHLKIK